MNGLWIESVRIRGKTEGCSSHCIRAAEESVGESGSAITAHPCREKSNWQEGRTAQITTRLSDLQRPVLARPDENGGDRCLFLMYAPHQH